MKLNRILHKHIGEHVYGLRRTSAQSCDAIRYKVLSVHDNYAELLRTKDKEVAFYHRDNGGKQTAIESGDLPLFQFWFLSRDDCKTYLASKKRKVA